MQGLTKGSGNVAADPVPAINGTSAFNGDFHESFDPSTYLERRFKNPGKGVSVMINFALENLNQFFMKYDKRRAAESQAGSHSLKVLDYGCGPVIAYNISAARVASEIVLAEYTRKSRELIKKWLDQDPKAWDWSPYFKHVVETIEGRSESATEEREKDMRKVIKAVVECDITKDPPIAKGFEGPYDIVISTLAIESGCKTLADYVAAIKKIFTLLIEGGHLLIYVSIRNKEGLGCYYVGEQMFHPLCLTEEFVLKTLRESGFTIVKNNPLPEEGSMAIQRSTHTDLDSTSFVVALKPHQTK